MSVDCLPEWAQFAMKANELALDNIGIKVKIPWIPEYVELRDRLAMMNPVRRWLSFRLRRQLKELRREQQVLVFNATIEASRAD